MWLYVIKRKYDIWQNPLYVWEAITFCINHKKSLPAWTLSYLSEAGGNLLEATKTGTDKGNPKTVRDAMKFNLGHGTSPFTNYLTTEKYIKVALESPKIIKKINTCTVKIVIAANETTIGDILILRVLFVERTHRGCQRLDVRLLANNFITYRIF